MKRAKFFILWHILLLFLFINLIPSKVEAKILIYTLLERTRKSEIVALAKCINIQDEEYELDLSMMAPEEKLKSPRFAVYEIIEMWKGKYDKDALLLDYKLTNEKYRPFICRPAVHPAAGELVILFLEKNFVIFAGFQGKISVDEKSLPLYRDAIMKFLKLDTLSEKEKVLSTIKMVDDRNRYVKESMLRELNEIDNTKYGIEIANLLKHKDAFVRQRAMSALIRTKDKRVVPLVIEALKDSDPRVRKESTTVLWRINDGRITPALMEVFNDEDAGVRRGVIFALYHRGSGESIPLYLKALKDNDPLVRAFGVNAFGWVHEPKVVPELLNALKDENARVRETAVRALYSYIPRKTIESSTEIVNEIINAVISLLDDENSMVRKEVAYSIAETGWKGYEDMLRNDEVINKLLQIVEIDKDYRVRNHAIMALGAITCPQAIPVLLKSLSDTQIEIRASAATALSKIGDKRVLPQLKEALKKEKNKYVKKQLETAIKRLEELKNR